jgi:hypothetical protein
LGGKNRRHQKLKSRGVIQGAVRVGVFFFQPFDYLGGVLFSVGNHSQ